jgi:hypothetical protein
MERWQWRKSAGKRETAWTGASSNLHSKALKPVPLSVPTPRRSRRLSRIQASVICWGPAASSSHHPGNDPCTLSATDRAGLERQCRYVLRPPFAEERLRQRGPRCASTFPGCWLSRPAFATLDGSTKLWQRAPGAAGVRVWEVMSLGRGPRRRCPPPEGVDVAYPPVHNHFVLSRHQRTCSAHPESRASATGWKRGF